MNTDSETYMRAATSLLNVAQQRLREHVSDARLDDAVLTHAAQRFYALRLAALARDVERAKARVSEARAQCTTRTRSVMSTFANDFIQSRRTFN